jgi:organic radical activating enzyme
MKRITKVQIGHFMRLVDRIPLVEHFYSFQGEGRFAGTPSIFIRLGGCNLNCKGFGVYIDGIIGCDSIKAVHEDRYSHEWLYVDDLKPIIEKHLIDLTFKPDIVFTGGEPLTHHENSILLNTLEEFISRGYRVTFETNATIEIDFKKYPIYKDVVFAMSVKLENSGEAKDRRVKKDAIKKIVKNTKSSFFKFVINKDDLNNIEIKEITDEFKDTPIYCMPMGSRAKELSLHDKHVASYCLKYGYNYVDRMHIRLYDNEEGR